MKNDLIKTSTPEEMELLNKKIELEKFSDILAEKELSLEELKLTVTRFQHRYYSVVGKRYVEFDELSAQIAEIKSSLNHQDNELNQEALNARAQAKDSAEEYDDFESEPQVYSSLKTEKSEYTKKLYRKIAAIIHPDKTTDEKSHHIRTQLMVELNAAHAQRDIDKMQRILADWHESPEAVIGEGTAAELVRIIRTIAQVKRRISQIETEISEITSSDTHILMDKVHEADLAGRDILAEMSVSLDSKIQDAKDELTRIMRKKSVYK